MTFFGGHLGPSSIKNSTKLVPKCPLLKSGPKCPISCIHSFRGRLEHQRGHWDTKYLSKDHSRFAQFLQKEDLFWCHFMPIHKGPKILFCSI